MSRRALNLTAICLILVIVHTYHTAKLFRVPRQKTPKTILWYYPPRYLPDNLSTLVPLAACPHLNCYMTRNRTFLPVSDAVIFSAEHIRENVLPERNPGQMWIFHNNEPPFQFAFGRPFLKKPWKTAFNWTMDYRYDADIVRPYALLRKKHRVQHKNYEAIVKKKTKKVAIMVSNCENWSGRLNYAHELNKTIPVDIFGKCGRRLFPREKYKEWQKYLVNNYKFYLAFENLYCLDYISEKFFFNFNLDIVTVARGGGNYSRDTPPGTYINAGDYNSPKELGDYLLYLDNNTDKYIDIIKKKEQYYFEMEEYAYVDSIKQNYREYYYEKKPLCELCHKLRNIGNRKISIPNILPWFKKGICKQRDI